MSAVTKKPPPSSTPTRRPSPADPSPTSSRTPPRTPSAATNGSSVPRTRPTRTGTPVSARAAMQRPGAGASKLSISGDNVEAEEEARAENIALVEELKERLHAAETVSEKYQKEALVLQSRLDEALNEQGKLEERIHESEERLEVLENEKREASRQRSQMESIYEAERSSMTKEREAMATREEEMQAVIQRLKDNLASRSNNDNEENRENRLSRRSGNSSPSIDNGHFAPPAELARSDSRSSSKLVLQKDRLIESLRLELAEAQIKLVETENMGGGRLQEIEKLLLETRMANARLMEDNESFQLLLQEKTLNGEFSKHDFGYMGAHSNADALSALEGRAPASSLADELSEAGEGESEYTRRLEAEVKAVKDQNKALTVYINKIISRLLMHQDFEAILDQSSDFKPPTSSNKDKELPPPPQASGTTVLQRAKSIATAGPKARPRPMSQMPASHSALTDPDTAPSIPFGLNRSSSMKKRRPMSEQLGTGAANVVNQMYRGQSSPPLHGPQTPRHSASFFSPPTAGGNPNAAARMPSGNSVPTVSSGVAGNFPGEKKGERSETSSISSSVGDVTTPPSTSPPRSEKETEKRTSFAGGKPRPLRLVQENSEKNDAEANKRASWFGWAIGKKDESIPE